VASTMNYTLVSRTRSKIDETVITNLDPTTGFSCIGENPYPFEALFGR
jgi:hypothetical protein